MRVSGIAMCGALLVASVGMTVGMARAADMATKSPPPPAVAAPVPYVTYWAGFDGRDDSAYGYAGAVFALNRNLNVDGWLFRISGGDGEYSYQRVLGSNQNVNFQNGDVMVGYQTFVGQTRLTGYLGGYIQNDNNSDPAAKVTGTRGGVKVQGEIYTPLNTNWYAFGLAAYTSAWNGYDLMGRLGYQLTPTVSIGPEAMALGNDRYGEARGGGFIGFNITPLTQLILSGGYSWDTRITSLNNQSGGYGTVHVRFSF